MSHQSLDWQNDTSLDKVRPYRYVASLARHLAAGSCAPGQTICFIRLRPAYADSGFSPRVRRPRCGSATGPARVAPRDAADLAGLSDAAFRRELGKRGVPYSAESDEDVDEQIRRARKSMLDR